MVSLLPKKKTPADRFRETVKQAMVTNPVEVGRHAGQLARIQMMLDAGSQKQEKQKKVESLEQAQIKAERRERLKTLATKLKAEYGKLDKSMDEQRKELSDMKTSIKEADGDTLSLGKFFKRKKKPEETSPAIANAEQVAIQQPEVQ